MIDTRKSQYFVSLVVLSLILIMTIAQSYSTSSSQFSLARDNIVYAASQPATSIHLQNGSIIFKVQNTVVAFNSQTGSLSSITNLLTDQFTQLNGAYPLWYISTTNGSYSASNSNHFSYLITSDGLLIMNWGIPNPQFAVQVIVKADANDGGVDMAINVSNYSPSVTIVSVEFPYLAGFRTLGNSPSSDYLAIPKRDGLVIPNFQQTLAKSGTIRIEYTGSLTMQFFLIYDNNVGGIYEGVEDPASNYKALEIQNSTYTSPLFKFYWELYAPNIYPGNQFTANYSVTIAGFSGTGWENGAVLYRDWAVKQFYTENGPLLSRTDVPDWFKDIGIIWKVSPPDNQTPSIASTVKSTFPNQTALLDLWGWNRYGFDSGYGNYFPPIEGENTLTDAINQIHEEGDHIILFLSGDLYDTNTTLNPDFSSVEKYMVITSDGQLYIQEESNGARMAVPDPTSDWWESELVNFSITAVKEYDADGVYLDGLVDQPVILNYQNATHPTLSGSSWWQGYAQILSSITDSIRQYNPNAIVTTEGESEIFIPYLDGFWDNMDQDSPAMSGIPGAVETPMFSFVYHEYELSYGTPYVYSLTYQNVSTTVQYPDLFRYTLGKAFTYGLVLRPGLPPYTQLLPADIAYLSSAIQLEQTYSPYLRFGQLLPVPYVDSDNYTYYFPVANSSTYPLTVPAVSAGLYQSNNGSDLLAVSNPTPLSQNITLKFSNTEFGTQQILQSVEVCEMASDNPDCSVTNDSGYVNLSMANLSNIVLRVLPNFENSIAPSINISSSSSFLSTISTSSSSSYSGNHSTKSVQVVLPWYAITIIAILTVGVPLSVFMNFRRRRRLAVEKGK